MLKANKMYLVAGFHEASCHIIKHMEVCIHSGPYFYIYSRKAAGARGSGYIEKTDLKQDPVKKKEKSCKSTVAKEESDTK